jgi:hypothetical protein
MTSSSPDLSDEVTIELNVRAPRWFARNKRSAERKRLSERPRTPSWWRSAKYSKRRSLRVDKADLSAAIVRKALRIASRMASG